MQILGMVKQLAAQVGVHLSWAKDHPTSNWLGLKRFPIRTIFDVGANAGQFAVTALEAFNEADIVCIEPQRVPLMELEKIAQRNPRLKVFATALGTEVGTIEMFEHCDHSPSSSVLRATEESKQLYPFISRSRKIQVPITRLDLLVQQINPKPAFEWLVKLDVQGYERQVLEGGTATIANARACIVEGSLDPMYEGQLQFEEMVRLFSDLGFSYAGNLNQVTAPDKHVVYVDSLFVSQRAAQI